MQVREPLQSAAKTASVAVDSSQRRRTTAWSMPSPPHHQRWAPHLRVRDGGQLRADAIVSKEQARTVMAADLSHAGGGREVPVSVGRATQDNVSLLLSSSLSLSPLLLSLACAPSPSPCLSLYLSPQVVAKEGSDGAAGPPRAGPRAHRSAAEARAVIEAQPSPASTRIPHTPRQGRTRRPRRCRQRPASRRSRCGLGRSLLAPAPHRSEAVHPCSHQQLL